VVLQDAAFVLTVVGRWR